MEIALAVHEPDAEQGQGLVGGLLREVAGERAEAARVDRERRVDPVLGAYEGHGPHVVVALGERAVEVGQDGLLHGLGPLDELDVAGGAGQRLGGRLLEQPNRIALAGRPAALVDVPEQVRAARHPGPAVVECDAGEDGQWCRESGGQGRRRLGDVVPSRPGSSHTERGPPHPAPGVGRKSDDITGRWADPGAAYPATGRPAVLSDCSMGERRHGPWTCTWSRWTSPRR